jgi:hypothetical protein
MCCRHLTASAEGPQVHVSVRVTHPTLGAYFDAHLLLKLCPPHLQGPAETGGLMQLCRWELGRGGGKGGGGGGYSSSTRVVAQLCRVHWGRGGRSSILTAQEWVLRFCPPYLQGLAETGGLHAVVQVGGLGCVG